MATDNTTYNQITITSTNFCVKHDTGTTVINIESVDAEGALLTSMSITAANIAEFITAVTEAQTAINA